MNVMEESCAKHDNSRFYDGLNMNEVPRNSMQANSMQVKISDHPNEGASSPKSQDPDGGDEDELSRLKALATDVREQVDLERDVGRQVCYSIKSCI